MSHSRPRAGEALLRPARACRRRDAHVERRHDADAGDRAPCLRSGRSRRAACRTAGCRRTTDAAAARVEAGPVEQQAKSQAHRGAVGTPGRVQEGERRTGADVRAAGEREVATGRRRAGRGGGRRCAARGRSRRRCRCRSGSSPALTSPGSKTGRCCRGWRRAPAAWPTAAAARTLCRCCGCRPGLDRPARTLARWNALPVSSDRARLVRRICPPPSPKEPSSSEHGRPWVQVSGYRAFSAALTYGHTPGQRGSRPPPAPRRRRRPPARRGTAPPGRGRRRSASASRRPRRRSRPPAC